MKTVPAITIRSASRGVPRITSAPNLDMSYLLVMLVAISTKQQERPKLKGQTEFLRPHATRSSRREMISVRRIASSGCSRFTPAWGSPVRLIDQRIKHRRYHSHCPSAALSPIQPAHAPKVD